MICIWERIDGTERYMLVPLSCICLSSVRNGGGGGQVVNPPITAQDPGIYAKGGSRRTPHIKMSSRPINCFKL